jgi:hypothetical protein
MDRQDISSPVTRVVMLTRDSAALGLEPEDRTGLRLQCIRVSSPYEAAAEILAAPTLGLVVDLGVLSTRHLRLLEITRRMEVEILAFGNLPAGMNTEQLSGVRLISRGELGNALRRLIQAEERQSASPAPPEPPALERSLEEALGKYYAESPQPTSQEKDAASGSLHPSTPQDLLTPEELSALLENEP